MDGEEKEEEKKGEVTSHLVSLSNQNFDLQVSFENLIFAP